MLSVISRSPNALQPVLDSIVETAQRLCQSDRAQFFKLENGKYHLASQQGTNPDLLKYLAENPISVDAQSGSATKAVRERQLPIRRRDNRPAPPIFTDRRLIYSLCFLPSSTFTACKAAVRRSCGPT
jgi:hypothetical protein